VKENNKSAIFWFTILAGYILGIIYIPNLLLGIMGVAFVILLVVALLKLALEG